MSATHSEPPPRAMVLAAGRGERMRPLTDTVPKPLLEVGGRSLLARHIDALVGAGIREIVVNHAWLGERIEAALGDGSALGARIRYSPEARALETAGGIATALPLLGDAPFVVVNGDIFCDFDFRLVAGIVTRMRAADLLAWCVLVANPPHNRDGDFGIDGERLLEQAPARLTFAGIGVYAPELFAGIAPGTPAPLAPLLRAAARQGRAGAMVHGGRWTDVGTPQRLARLDAEIGTGRGSR